jgi:hypothetical protein
MNFILFFDRQTYLLGRGKNKAYFKALPLHTYGKAGGGGGNYATQGVRTIAGDRKFCEMGKIRWCVGVANSWCLIVFGSWRVSKCITQYETTAKRRTTVIFTI